MWKYLIKKGYVKLVFEIGNNKKNITQLSKDAGMTISHLARVLNRWEKEGLVVKTITEEKSSEIYLTEQGKKLSIILNDIYHIANRAESQLIKLEEKEWKEKKNQKSSEKSSLTQEEKSSESEQPKQELPKLKKEKS